MVRLYHFFDYWDEQEQESDCFENEAESAV